MAPRTDIKIAELQVTDCHALELQNFKLCLFAHFSDLAVSSLVKLHTDNRKAFFSCNYRAIYGHNSIAVNVHRLSQGFKLFGGNLALYPDVINFRDLVFGVHKLICEFAVICEEEETLGIHIKSADWINSRSDVLDKLCYALSVLIVGKGSDVTARLVQHNVYLSVVGIKGDDLSLICNPVLTGNYLLTECGSLTVDLDPARFDFGFGGTTAHNTC